MCVGFARTPCTLGKERVPPFPSVSPQDPGSLCCASISLLELLLRTRLRTTGCSCLGWAPGRARPKAHQPPEGRGAKLPPGTAQSCLGEADRGDLFPRAPSWRGAGRLGSASVSLGGGCLPPGSAPLGPCGVAP